MLFYAFTEKIIRKGKEISEVYTCFGVDKINSIMIK